MAKGILEVKNLTKQFSGKPALSNISFNLLHNETLGVVGESGSGKSTLIKCILRAIDADSGTIVLNMHQKQVDITTLSEKQLKPIRQKLQVVLQDPYSSLNPRMTIKEIIEEPLIIHGFKNKATRRSMVEAALKQVQLDISILNRYPHAFSGGQRQRICIARALILKPEILICDESLSALDVSIQAQIINLLNDLKQENGLTYIFVSHDLSVVRHLCDRILVMYKGNLVESGSTSEIFNNPKANYTRLLLSAIPSTDPDKKLMPLDRKLLGL